MTQRLCAAGHAYVPGNGCDSCRREKARDRQKQKYAHNAQYREAQKAYQLAKTSAEDVERRTKRLASNAVYAKRRREDPERYEAYKRARREADRARSREKRDQANEAFRLRYEADVGFRDRILANAAKGRLTNTSYRLKQRLKAQRRRARLRGARSAGITAKQWVNICRPWTNADGETQCAYCRKACAATIDHIVPTSRGGRDEVDNVLPACLGCNSSKRDRLIWEWPRAVRLNAELLKALTEHTRAHLAQRAA